MGNTNGREMSMPAASASDGGVVSSSSEIGTLDDSLLINQGTASRPQPQLAFHAIHGANVKTTKGGRVAKRYESFCKGLAFSNRPIAVDENVCIKFTEVATNWSGVLRFGVTNIDPNRFRGTELPKFACPDLTNKEGHWAKALPERYCVEGSILHFYVNEEGDLYYGINGVLKGMFLNGINARQPFWVMLDIYGNSTALEFIDPNEVRIRSTGGRHGGGGNGANNNRTATATTTAGQRRSMSTVETSTSAQTAGTSQGPLASAIGQLSLSPNIATPTRFHAGIDFDRLPFHTVRGKNVTLRSDYTVGERHATEFSCGYVFTARPINVNEKIVVQVLSTQPAFAGGLAFGLTCCDPIQLQQASLPVDSDDLLERQEYWVGIKDVGAQPNANDEMAFWISEMGEVFFYKNNGTPRIVMHVDNSLKLWAWFDIYGSTQKIRIMGSTRSTSLPSSITAPTSGNQPSRVTLPIAHASSARRAVSVQDALVANQRSGTGSATAATSSSSSSAAMPLRVSLPPPLNAFSLTSSSSAGVLEQQNRLNNQVPSTPPVSSRSSASITQSGALSAAMLPAPPLLPVPIPLSSSSSAQQQPPRPPPPALPPRPSAYARAPVVSGGGARPVSPPGGVSSADECTICMSSRIDCVIYACGHMCACFDCATETWRIKGECPICRQRITDVIRTFKA